MGSQSIPSELTEHVLHTLARGRCQCYGECGTRGAAGRGCADPDLTGRCRAEQGKPHPRSELIVELTLVDLDDLDWQPGRNPNRLRAYCQDCEHAFHATRRGHAAPGDLYELFPESETP